MRSRSARAAASCFCFSSCCCVDFFAVFGDAGFRFLQVRFRVPHSALEFFAGHHHVQLAIFGFSHFRFGGGNFVKQRLIRLVGFHCAALVAIFSRAVFPLVDVQLEFLALLKRVGVGFLGGSNGGASRRQSGVGFPNEFGITIEFGAQRANVVVNPLQFDKVRNCRVH